MLGSRFTSALSTEIIREFRAALALMGETLVASDPLESFAQDLEWFAREGDGHPDALAPAAASDVHRAARVYSGFLQFQAIAAGLKACASIIPVDHRIRWALHEPYDRVESLDKEAQDHLFELEVAGWLVRRGLSVAFEEPDITCQLPKIGVVALACKRPHNLKRLKRRISSGAEQLERNARPGVVVIDLQPLMFATGDPVRPTYLDQHVSEAAFLRSVEERLDDWARAARKVTLLARKDRAGFLGAVFAAMAWGEYRVGDDVANAWAWVARPSPLHTEAEVMVSAALRGLPPFSGAALT